MATLLLNLEDDLLQELLAGASAENSNLDDYIGQLLLSASGSTPVAKSKVATQNNMLKDAVSRATQKTKGEEFRLQDLFDPIEWNPESPTTFGRNFRKAVEGNIAEHIGKDPQNKAIYKRM